MGKAGLCYWLQAWEDGKGFVLHQSLGSFTEQHHAEVIAERANRWTQVVEVNAKTNLRRVVYDNQRFTDPEGKVVLSRQCGRCLGKGYLRTNACGSCMGRGTVPDAPRGQWGALKVIPRGGA